VVERKNMAIVGAAKSMLYDQDLPSFLWAKAYNTTIYIQNGSPHKVFGRNTPEEVFKGRRPKIGHFGIFGCLFYCHIPSEKRKKLEATTKKRIFIGYNENYKEYKVYIPSSRKTMVSMDVRFEEDRALRKAHDTNATIIGDHDLETQNTEET
jgi:hypothetical protein